MSSYHLSFSEYINDTTGISLPSSWNNITLVRVFDNVKQTTDADSLVHLTPSVVHGVVPQSELENRPQKALRDGYELTPAKPGDFVISMSSYEYGFEYCDRHGGISPDYTLLRPQVDKSHIQFLKYLAKSDPFISMISLYSRGIRQGKRIYWSQLKGAKICLPTVEEAEHIGAFLDYYTSRIDDIIKKNQLLLKLLEEKKESLLTEFVTSGSNPKTQMKDSDIDWLGKIPEYWDIIRTRFLCKITTGSGDTQDAVPDGKYPFVVRSPHLERSNTYIFDGEGVLTAGDGAGVGEVFHHMRGKFHFHQRVYLFYDFQNIIPLYFYYYMKALFSAVALAENAKSTVNSLRRPMLLDFPVAVPPISEQESIVQSIKNETKKIDNLHDNINEQISLLKEKRQALIAAAVTGQIDVSDWNPPDKEAEVTV